MASGVFRIQYTRTVVVSGYLDVAADDNEQAVRVATVNEDQITWDASGQPVVAMTDIRYMGDSAEEAHRDQWMAEAYNAAANGYIK